MTDGPKLVSDNPNPERKPWAKESVEDPEQIVCYECNGSIWIKADSCPFYQNFKVIPGSERLVCVQCLSESKVTTWP